MSRICQICQRSSNKANQRSHSNIATIRRQEVNLHKKKQANGKVIKVCTKCLRKLNTVKAV